MMPPPLPPDTRIGAVHLRVVDLVALTSFYTEVLGLQLLAEDDATVALAAHRLAPPLLVLHGAHEDVPSENGSPGLFHVAFRMPRRQALSGMLRRLHERGVPLDGFADHNVSEAIYLRDPEGNGLELYADRDAGIWRTVDEEIFITTEPLDVDGLLGASEAPADFPEDADVGHIHLQVSSLSTAEAFYVHRLGLGLVTRRIRDALFLAAGNYHHHVGVNTWRIRRNAHRSAHGPGLIAFELVVPDLRARRRLTGGAAEGLLLDPDGIGVRVVAER